MVDHALEYAKRNHDRHLAELKEFLAIPTISTLSEHAADMKRGATWLEQRLVSIGLRNVKVIPSTGHPLVYGDWAGVNSAPTVLLYGHYDVIPVDPLGEWISPPFEPAIRGDYIFARGATDMKTNAIAVLAAVEACLRVDDLPVSLKVLFEGEEEGGITNTWAIEDYMKSHHDELKCDVSLCADALIAGKNLPSLAYGTRGALGLRVWVRGPEVDLHSGEFGGAVQNPAHVLCELIAGMHDQDGRVTLPHFYDDVRALSEEEHAELARDPCNDEEWKVRVARVKQLYGEKGFTTAERIGARPTLEVKTFVSGEGGKNVIPASAMARISMRLVPHQDYQHVEEGFMEYMRNHAPAAVTWDVERTGWVHPAVVSRDSIGMRAASAALQETFGVKPIFRLEGGTSPIMSLVKEELGVDVVSLGFTLPDDGMHSPNEKFYLPNFNRAIETYMRFFQNLVT